MPDPTTLELAQAAVGEIPTESLSRDAGVREQLAVGRAQALVALALAEEIQSVRELLAERL